MVGLVDKNGNTVVSYTYDSWGKPLSTTGSLASTLGADQPFRYRGYIYDNETGWYYLKSRYYNPSIGRFISADVLLSTRQGVLGHNAYAYCLNNPINMSDETGYRPGLCSEVMVEGGRGTNSHISKSISLTTTISKTHVTRSIDLLNLGILFGKVTFSTTVTYQDQEAGLIYTCTDIGTDVRKSSVGINIFNCFGVDIGYSDEPNVFINKQISSLHYEISIGLDGVTEVYGIDTIDNYGNTVSYDLEVTCGIGPIAIALAIASLFSIGNFIPSSIPNPNPVPVPIPA